MFTELNISPVKRACVNRHSFTWTKSLSYFCPHASRGDRGSLDRLAHQQRCAAGIENNDERNFKDLRGMRRNTKSLKWNKRICKGILIAPSKLPRLSLVVDILRVDFSIHCLHYGRLRVQESRHGWLADSSLGQRGCPSARKRDLARLPWAPQ